MCVFEGILTSVCLIMQLQDHQAHRELPPGAAAEQLSEEDACANPRTCLGHCQREGWRSLEGRPRERPVRRCIGQHARAQRHCSLNSSTWFCMFAQTCFLNELSFSCNAFLLSAQAILGCNIEQRQAGTLCQLSQARRQLFLLLFQRRAAMMYPCTPQACGPVAF